MAAVSDWDDDEFERESFRDRLAFQGRRARRHVGRALRALHLTRVADALDPPLSPWWLQRPMGYIEHFAATEEQPVEAVEPAPECEDVLLSQMRFRDEAKRKKLIEVAFTEPDPKLAGEAAAELRRMIFEGPRA